MGIRLDQLHSEVFEKVAADIKASSDEFKDYLDNKIGELEVSFGLPETTQINHNFEINKRNLEKSGFIELNRNFVAVHTAEQKDVGVWISNLDTNESPFEPKTVDGQKRGISIAGTNFNYTSGNIGQNVDKMIKLPIAPNLPVFYPEQNDMIYKFQPKKQIVNNKIVTDSAISIKIIERITDNFKIDIDQMEVDGELKYYYLDENEDIVFLNDEGRSYKQADPDTLLVEPYSRFNKVFGQKFQFEKIYDDYAIEQYIDPNDDRLFRLVTPESSDAKKVQLLTDDGKDIFLDLQKVTRYEEDDNGNYVAVEVEQYMMTSYEIKEQIIDGLKTEILVPTLVSQAGFEKKKMYLTDGTEVEYVEDQGVKVFLENKNLYYYHPYSKYVLDEDGNQVLDEDGNPKTVVDETYVDYITFDEITDPENMTISVTDNLTGETVDREVSVITKQIMNYYRVDTLMIGDIGSDYTTLDYKGDYVEEGNVNRPLKINDDGQLTTLTGGLVDIVSEGKAFYRFPVGTKYYVRIDDGQHYFIDSFGNIYFPDNDVEQIFRAEKYNQDIDETTEILVYAAGDYEFYVDTTGLRVYVIDESLQAIQMTDINGYRVFVLKSDNSKEVYIYASDDGSIKKVTFDENGNEISVDYDYSELDPKFEVEEVLEYVLNKVIPIPFNIIQGDVTITRNDNELTMYSDYEIEGNLILQKPLEFNEETRKGDTLYVKRVGKKDIILRLEKKGTPEDDYAGNWANNDGQIVMPEILTGNSYNWLDGQELQPGEELDYNDIVKRDDERFFKYTGTAVKYEDLPDDDKRIHVIEGGIYWEEVTAQEVEWERKGQNYKIFNLEKGDVIRFTVTRRVWKQNETTGEMLVEEQDPYTVEKTALQDGDNVFVISDPNFVLDDDPTLESYLLSIEKIEEYGTYTDNRANDFKLTLTGLQTVAVNDDPAMIYGESYFLDSDILILNDVEMEDNMVIIRRQVPQAELKITFVSESEAPVVEVPFDIQKNEYDIVIPQTLEGHEYTWIMGDRLPEGKALLTGDVIFDKENIKFYKFIGEPKYIETPNGKEIITKKSLLRLTLSVQKELLRQYSDIKRNLNGATHNDDDTYTITDENVWFSYFDEEWEKRAKDLAEADGKTITFRDDDGNLILTGDAGDYLTKAKELWILDATDELNDDSVDMFEVNSIMSEETKEDIKEILNSDLDQTVLKLPKYNDDGTPALDEDGNQIYYYKYTRKFMVLTDDNGDFIEYDITGNMSYVNNKWEDITAPNVGYYRFGKTFTILETKAGDAVVVRLKESGADVFTSKRVVSENGGELTFAIDFNIEEDDGTEIPFEVIYEEMNWEEGVDYIQEGQVLTLTMVQGPGQEITIQRNDKFELSEIVVLERKDLVFIETWHEAVDETGFIFPFGNVQYQGDTADGIQTIPFDHVFYQEVDGENTIVPNGANLYCQAYQKNNVVYNYYDGTDFVGLTDDERKFIDDTFVEDTTIGRGWKLEDLTEEERTKIFQNADHNLYFDGEKLIQIRYRTRVVALNLFKNYFKGTSEYMSEGLRFQGKSPITSRVITREVGEDVTGEPITETIQIFAGGNLIHASSPNSLLYKEGKLFDDALFTVEEPTDLSYNGYVHAIPVAIIDRRNQGVYHPEYNDNGTAFFINGIYVSEDEKDFDDDITGFTLVDENGATLETASTGRDRKAKFKVMLKWLFDNNYKAGGSMVSKTTYRPDGLLYDEINVNDIIDLRIDANDQRRRIENLEANVTKGFNDLAEFRDETNLKFDQTENYINTTANLLYEHITETELAIRKDMDAKDLELEEGLELTNTNLADLSANVFTKDVTTNLLIDTIVGLVDMNSDDAFKDSVKPTKDEIAGMINAFVENMEGPYTKTEFMKFLVTVLKLVVDKTMLSDDELEAWIKRLSIKDLSQNPDTETYSRLESLELIYEGLCLASSARVLPPVDSDNVENWGWSAKRYDGWLGTRYIDLEKDFINTDKTPVKEKIVNVSMMTKTYTDRYGKTWNKGYLAGPTIWGNVHNYHAIYTAWIFVDKPFKLEYVKMNGDDTHAIFINHEEVATNKHCCRDTVYSYNFEVRGWYRIDMTYSEHGGGHFIQLGWNPKDYTDNIKYMTTKDMDEAVRITKLRLDNWASKLKTLISTIKGDASGYFTKLETKLIMIEGLKRIMHDILEYGPTVTEAHIEQFNTGDAENPGLESWLDNLNGDGTFSALGYEVQDGTNPDGSKYPRPDEFRPLPDLEGYYNKDEVLEIVRKGLQLVNGIDSLDSDTIQKWMDRLIIKIDMDEPRYYTKFQIETLIKSGKDYLAGLDTVTSYEISDWLDNFVTNYDLANGGTDVDRVFHDANGVDLSETTTDNTYTKTELRDYVVEQLKSMLGAQAV